MDQATPGPSGPVKLLIGIASGRGWSAKTAYSFGQLMFHLGNTRLGGRLVGQEINVHMQAYLCVARNDLLCKALDEGFTHFLSLDDDMVFPPDLVDRLLAHDKGVVTCNYSKKLLNRAEGTCGDSSGKNLTSSDSTGLGQVFSMGMGAVLFRTEDLRSLPRPYFAVVWSKDQQGYLIEDGVFSKLLAEHSIPIWCDHDLSREIGHMGEIEFRLPAYTPPQMLPLAAE